MLFGLGNNYPREDRRNQGFVLLFVILMIAADCFPQSSEAASADCPAISIQTPAGIAQPGDRLHYSAILSNGSAARLDYLWSVKGGKVVNGQGTDAIEIIYDGDAGFKITVKVKGLPAKCLDTASEGLHFSIDPGPIELGRISGSRYLIGKRLLSKIAREGRKHPNAQIYLMVYFPTGTPDNQTNLVRANIARQLKGTGIDEARFTLRSVEAGSRKAVIWLIRPGVDDPTP